MHREREAHNEVVKRRPRRYVSSAATNLAVSLSSGELAYTEQEVEEECEWMGGSLEDRFATWRRLRGGDGGRKQILPVLQKHNQPENILQLGGYHPPLVEIVALRRLLSMARFGKRIKHVDAKSSNFLEGE